jgi:hypothetical protein
MFVPVIVLAIELLAFDELNESDTLLSVLPLANEMFPVPAVIVSVPLKLAITIPEPPAPPA